MRAEREKRATILGSERLRDSAINTAEGIRSVAEAIEAPGGYQAVQLRVAEQYIEKLGMLAKQNNTMILPANMADISSIIATAMAILRGVGVTVFVFEN